MAALGAAAPRPAALPRRALLLAIIAPLGACSGLFGSGSGVAPSPRVVTQGEVAKGGGSYKVGRPYRIGGRWYHPKANDRYDRTGVASWYGSAFHGRKTANGEIYDMNALSAGHPTLPMPSLARVTNLANGRSILVRINDRGPYVADRLIDLSQGSARALGYEKHGLTRVRVRYVGPAPLNGDDSAERRFLAAQPWYRGNLVAGVTPAPAATGSIRTAKVRTVPMQRPVQVAEEAAPEWTVMQYRHGQSSGGGQPLPSALGRTTGDTYLRVGPFATESEAERLRHMLAGDEPGIVERLAEGAYGVRLGPFDDDAAAAAMARIAGAGFDPLVSTEASPAQGQKGSVQR